MALASSIAIRPFVDSDITDALSVWSAIEGLGLSESDDEESISFFLKRNPGFSAVATSEGELVGTVLCGHNGRAGFLYHLAVAPSFRRCGIATRLIEFCFAKLGEARIPRCNVFVYTANESGNQFWLRRGWNDPTTWKVLQKFVEPGSSSSGRESAL